MDESAYWRLVDASRDHVSQHGDYSDLKAATRASVHTDIGHSEPGHLRVLGWVQGEAVGRFDFIARDRGQFVLGYWLAPRHAGHGYATVACRALIEYGHRALGATDVWAGVTKGNASSEAVLGRLGLKPIKDMGTYVRYHRSLVPLAGKAQSL